MTKIKAFTKAEWESPNEVLDGYINLDVGLVDVRLGGVGGVRNETKERHLLAALLLEGQPFGFTREDASEIRYLVDAATREWGDGDESKFLASLADRIEALLPPE